jgi:hypothetical protein
MGYKETPMAQLQHTHKRTTVLVPAMTAGAVAVVIAVTAVIFSGVMPLSQSGAEAGRTTADRTAADEAASARLQGLADREAGLARQRAESAYTARLQGLGQRHIGHASGRQQPMAAYAARLQGLADRYRQRAMAVYAARLQGLANRYTAQGR